jgi:hypothetical protein
VRSTLNGVAAECPLRADAPRSGKGALPAPVIFGVLVEHSDCVFDLSQRFAPLSQKQKIQGHLGFDLLDMENLDKDSPLLEFDNMAFE